MIYLTILYIISAITLIMLLQEYGALMLFYKARTLVGTGHYRRAYLPARIAAFLKPKHPAYSYLYGVTLSQLGDSKRAIKEFKRLLKLCPVYLPASIALANAYFDEGKRDEAVQTWKVAQQCDEVKLEQFVYVCKKKI